MMGDLTKLAKDMAALKRLQRFFADGVSAVDGAKSLYFDPARDFDSDEDIYSAITDFELAQGEKMKAAKNERRAAERLRDLVMGRG